MKLEHYSRVTRRDTLLAVESMRDNDPEIVELVKRLWDKKIYPCPFWHVASRLNDRGLQDVVGEALALANGWQSHYMST